MKSHIDCVHCYLKQAVTCMMMEGVAEDKQHDVLYRLMDEIKEFDRNASPAENSTIALHKTYELIGAADPYKEAKKQSNDLALGLYPGLREMLDRSEDRLYDALKISVSGNVIDLGVHRNYDVRAELKNSMEKGFSVDHYKDFAEKLSAVDEVLILGDNAGEIVLDRILAEELVRLGKRVVYVVKEGPVLNDATMEDVLYTGMDQTAEVITSGSNYLGTALSKVSEELKERLRRARLVISKGQANFESLEHVQEYNGKVFFMLKLKCEEVARTAGGAFGDVVLFTRS